MEKFSTWRDAATGLAPFVYPLPPLSDSPWLRVARLAWILFIPTSLLRTGALLILALLFTTIDKTCPIIFFFFSIHAFSRLQSYYSAAFARVALYLLGLTQLPPDPPFTHRTSSQKNLETKTQPGDLIVCNWSSFVEILYLTYLYNPLFILPVPELNGPTPPSSESESGGPIARGFQTKTALELISSSGNPPNLNPSNPAKTLVECLRESKRLKRVLVVFPEGTTSNNRALLKCFRLNRQSIGENDQLAGKIRAFCLAFKHESPTSTKNSITVPIPSRQWNLPNIFRANLAPILFPFRLSPRSITLRYPRNDFIQLQLPSSSSSSSSPSSLSSNHLDQQLVPLFDPPFDTLSSVAKLKLTSQINALDKYTFLNYIKSRKS